MDNAGDLLVIATDAPLPPYADFDPFGNVIGYNNAVIERIASRTGLAYEFVVTPSEGVLNNIAAGSARDFDAVEVPQAEKGPPRVVPWDRGARFPADGQSPAAELL